MKAWKLETKGSDLKQKPMRHRQRGMVRVLLITVRIIQKVIIVL